MKILFAGASGDEYGADAVVRSIAAHMQERAECVLFLPEHGPGKETAERHGLRVEVQSVPVLRKADLNPRGLLRLIASILPSAVSQMRVLRAERPDLVWVNTITIPLWILVARMLGFRVVCHSHEIVGGPLWLRRLIYLPLFLTRKIVVVSEANRMDIISACPTLDRRVLVALNPSFAIRGPLPVPPGSEESVVIVGRISARKGHGVLVEALGGVRLSPLRPVVHVCGEPYRSRRAQEFAADVRKRAAALGCDVRLHGFVPTETALAMGGVVVVPSLEPESCPLVIAEAMTAGRAVVASDCGGITEIAGGAALLVPAGSPDELAAALARVIVEPAERARLEEASLARAGSLSAERYLARIDRVVDDIADVRADAAARPLAPPSRSS